MSCSALFATGQADSLITQYNSATTDSMRLQYVKEICKKLRNSDPQQHIYYAQQGLQLAEQEQDTLLITFFLKDIGYYYKYQSMYDSALVSLLQAKPHAEQLDNKLAYIGVVSEIADVYKKSGELDKAIAIYYEAIKLSEEIELYDGLIACRFGLASIYEAQQDYTQALEQVKLTLPYCTEIDPKRAKGCQGAVYSNLAEFYFKLEKNDSAIYYGLQAKELKESAGYLMTIDLTYLLLGEAYFKEQDTAAAVGYYKKAFDIARKLNKTSGIVRASNFLLQHYTKTGELDKAEPVLTMHEIAEGDINDPALLRDYYLARSQYYELAGQHEEALYYNKKYSAIKDEILFTERLQIISEMEAKYETDKLKQEKIIETEKAEVNQVRFIAAAVAGLLIFILAGVLIYQLQLKRRAEVAEVELRETRNKLKLERKLNTAEQKALKAQMNPHFLFNAFNSIQEYIIMNQRELASDYLGKFADLMRLYLDHSREKSITLEDELAATELYLDLEKIRFEDTLKYEIKMADDVDTSEISIPPMLLQPFIENALKHGLLHKKDNRKLELIFKMADETLVCTIKDNGVGRARSAEINSTRQKDHKSFATSATQERIDLLNVSRDKNISLKITDQFNNDGSVNGTRVDILIPLA